MAVEVEPSTKFAEFAHPERLVTGDWLEKHLGTEASWSSNRTRTSCFTRPDTSPAR